MNWQWNITNDAFIDIGKGMVRVSEIAAAAVMGDDVFQRRQVVTVTLKNGVQIRTDLTKAEFRERLEEAARP